MKLLPLSALLAATLLAGAARAQSTVEFGPRLGVNLATMTSSGAPEGFNQDTKSVVGLQVGATVSIGLGTNLAFQPSLLFTQKGAEFTGSQTDRSNRPYVTTASVTATPKLHYLELPLNLVYTVGGAEGFQVFAGPYVALGVGGGGSFKGELVSNDPNYSPFAGTYPGSLKVEFAAQQDPNANNPSNPNSGALSYTFTARRFDAGFNGGFGYRFGPFQAQLGYGFGLVNFVPKDANGNDTGSKGYNRAFQLSANYFLGGK